MTTLGTVLLVWAAVLAVLVGALALASRRSRSRGPEFGAAPLRSADRRRAAADRRRGERDRRIGLPDLRSELSERRGSTPDRRGGMRDRRGTLGPA